MEEAEEEESAEDSDLEAEEETGNEGEEGSLRFCPRLGDATTSADVDVDEAESEEGVAAADDSEDGVVVALDSDADEEDNDEEEVEGVSAFDGSKTDSFFDSTSNCWWMYGCTHASFLTHSPHMNSLPLLSGSGKETHF